MGRVSVLERPQAVTVAEEGAEVVTARQLAAVSVAEVALALATVEPPAVGVGTAGVLAIAARADHTHDAPPPPDLTAYAALAVANTFTARQTIHAPDLATNALRIKAGGFPDPFLEVGPTGTLMFGSGNGAQDVNLYRAGAGVIEVGGRFRAGRFGVGVDPAAPLVLAVNAPGAADLALRLRLAPAATGDAMQVQASSGTVLLRATAAGALAGDSADGVRILNNPGLTLWDAAPYALGSLWYDGMNADLARRGVVLDAADRMTAGTKRVNLRGASGVRIDSATGSDRALTVTSHYGATNGTDLALFHRKGESNWRGIRFAWDTMPDAGATTFGLTFGAFNTGGNRTIRVFGDGNPTGYQFDDRWQFYNGLHAEPYGKPTVVPIVAKLAASATVDALQVQTSAGTVVASAGPAGELTARQLRVGQLHDESPAGGIYFSNAAKTGFIRPIYYDHNTGDLHLGVGTGIAMNPGRAFWNTAAGDGWKFSVEGTTALQLSKFVGGTALVSSFEAANPVLRVRGASGQTGDLLQTQDNAGAVIAAVKAGTGTAGASSGPVFELNNGANAKLEFYLQYGQIGRIKASGSGVTDGLALVAPNGIDRIVATNTGVVIPTGVSNTATGSSVLTINAMAATAVSMMYGTVGGTLKWQYDLDGRLGLLSGSGALAARLNVNPASATEVGAILKLAASATADALQVRSSTDAVLAKIGAAGQVTLKNTVGNQASPDLLIDKTGTTGWYYPIEVRDTAGAMAFRVDNGGSISALGIQNVTSGNAIGLGVTGRIDLTTPYVYAWTNGFGIGMKLPDGTKTLNLQTQNDGTMALPISVTSDWYTEAVAVGTKTPGNAGAADRTALYTSGRLAVNVHTSGHMAGTGAMVPLTVNHSGAWNAAGGETGVTGDLARFTMAGVTRMALTKAGDLELPTVGTGPVIKSPNGTRYRITVDNAGVLAAVAA